MLKSNKYLEEKRTQAEGKDEISPRGSSTGTEILYKRDREMITLRKMFLFLMKT